MGFYQESSKRPLWLGGQPVVLHDAQKGGNYRAKIHDVLVGMEKGHLEGLVLAGRTSLRRVYINGLSVQKKRLTVDVSTDTAGESTRLLGKRVVTASGMIVGTVCNAAFYQESRLLYQVQVSRFWSWLPLGRKLVGRQDIIEIRRHELLVRDAFVPIQKNIFSFLVRPKIASVAYSQTRST
ncbi:hypothetical protein COW46_00445 [Candidatus Gracilibacteria bacterium CG17_big_fil_post_rev_8_21_14_2_50_48_13]|nr:MAG: hypothetical protein COW46_00445 [Candidatus Gracilibacteria bacterium CG17_big_fil_post_rev_8_21_14_2_50_48_13]